MAITVPYADFIVFGMPERTLQGHPNNAVTSTQVDRFLAAAASEINACLEESGRRCIDEANPSEVIRQYSCIIAAWRVLNHLIGYNPENEADQAMRQSYQDAREWLKKVCDGMPVDGTEGIDGGDPEPLLAVATELPRGW